MIMDLCQLVSCNVERTFCLCWKTWTDCMIYKVFFLKNKPGFSGVFPPSGLGPDRNRVVMWALRIDLLQVKRLNSLSWALEMSLQAKAKVESEISLCPFKANTDHWEHLKADSQLLLWHHLIGSWPTRTVTGHFKRWLLVNKSQRFENWGQRV